MVLIKQCRSASLLEVKIPRSGWRQTADVLNLKTIKPSTVALARCLPVLGLVNGQPICMCSRCHRVTHCWCLLFIDRPLRLSLLSSIIRRNAPTRTILLRRAPRADTYQRIRQGDERGKLVNAIDRVRKPDIATLIHSSSLRHGEVDTKRRLELRCRQLGSRGTRLSEHSSGRCSERSS